jgi:hypothetical protein
MLPGTISGGVKKSMLVPVLDTNRKPLMPIKPALARLLLTQKKASAYWNKLGIFCIILHKAVENPSLQQIAVGIDPGSSFEGWSVIGTKITILNGMSEAPTHIKKAIEVRKNMRRARRHRNLWIREARFNNRLRNKQTLPPSTYARWNAKLRILNQLIKILPITDVVIEDVCTETKKGCKRWNTCFSPIEQGKQWLYDQIRNLGVTLHLKQGWETKELRDKFNLKKSSQKGKQSFSSHAVDAWVMAASVTGALKPTWLGLIYWAPIRLHRRQLHTFQPSKGGVRRPYGGTRSMGLSRGTLIKHAKFGLCYIGGTLKEKISLHSLRTGKRITQSAKILDCRILAVIRQRSTLFLRPKSRVFFIPVSHGVS